MERAERVAKRLVKTFGNSDHSIAAVIHADFKRKLMHQLLSPGLDAMSLGALVNTGVTKLEYDGDRWKLHWFNSVSHLPPKLITGIEH